MCIEVIVCYIIVVFLRHGVVPVRNTLTHLITFTYNPDVDFTVLKIYCTEFGQLQFSGI